VPIIGKSCGTDFQKFDFKSFGEFFKMSTLDSPIVSGRAAAEQSRPIGFL